MRIAIPYDFKHTTDIRREGIGVYLRFLLESILQVSQNITLEFYVYDFNKRNLECFLKDLISKYPKRIIIIDNSFFTVSEYLAFPFILCLYIFKFFYNKLKIYFYIICFFISRNKKYAKKIFKRKKIFNQYFQFKKNYLKNQNIKIKRKKLQKKAKESNADVMYAFFVLIELGHYFKCKKIVQVHDLFTVDLPLLFATQFFNIEEFNKQILTNLGKYAKKNAIFVSSSKYIKNQHCLKYIPNITDGQSHIISFPPMITNYKKTNEDIEHFKNRYNITLPYLAFPSQNRPNKNWKLIFKALKILKDKGIYLQFVTTGKINDLESDKILINNLGIKHLILEIGSISNEDLFLLYKYSSIHVASTIIEGMGISGQALEALNVGGIPIIHVRSLGIKESLENVGLTLETADLNWIDINDEVALAQKMEDILRNPNPHIKKQEHIIKAYTIRTWTDVANDYIKLFEGKN